MLACPLLFDGSSPYHPKELTMHYWNDNNHVTAQGVETQMNIYRGDSLILDGDEYQVIELGDEGIKVQAVRDCIYPARTRRLSPSQVDALNF
jgi:hypothetical protein